MDNGKNPCILVVDDVPDTLNILVNWLEMHNFQTLSAANGKQALEMATQHLPDLILLDVMMPEMDGIETCRRLKTRTQTASIPVVLVTAKDPSDARADGMIAGAVDYITKPVNLKDLTARVEYILSSHADSSQVDVQRLLEEVAHSAMAMLDSVMVWLLTLDGDTLAHQMLTTSSGTRDEAEFITAAANGHDKPVFSLQDATNPLVEVLVTRQISSNLPISRLSDESIRRACEQLNLSYLTVIPLIAAGKTAGVMALGYYQPHDMETPRAHQILSSFGSQAATALNYSRLIADLRLREQEAQREQAFRQMILDTMSDGLVVMDEKGFIKFTNRRLLRMTGYPEGYLEGRPVGELFHPEDRDEVMFGLLSEKAATMKFDQRLITSSDTVIPVLISRSRTPSNTLDNQVIVLSDMTEQKAREQELERQTGHLMALNQAAHVMTSNLSLYEVLNDILNSAIGVVEGQGASLFLVNRDETEDLLVVAAVGYRAQEFIGLRVPLGEGLAGWVAREAHSQLVTHPENDPRFYSGVDEKTGMSTRSLIAVPLVHGDQVIGVIEVVNKLNNGIFDADDVRLLESMAGTAAVSIMNARLYDQTQRRVSELATLLDASEAASSTLDLAQALDHIIHSLANNLDVAQSMVMAWPDQGKQLVSLAHLSRSFWPDVNGPLHDLVQNTVVQAALLTNQPLAASLEDPGIHAADRALLNEAGMTAVQAIPINRNGSAVGIVCRYSLAKAGYSQQSCDDAVAAVIQWQNNLDTTVPFIQTSVTLFAQLAALLLDKDDTCWVAIYGWSPGNPATRLLHETGFAEWTLRNGPHLLIEDFTLINRIITDQQVDQLRLSNVPTTAQEYEWLVQRGGQAALLVPLLLRGSTIGLVALIDINDRIFDDEEIRIAQGIANVMSNAIENARLYQSLQGRARALEGAYTELQEADHAKDQFIQNVSHELRTPLIHVMGYAELLADNTFGEINDEQREALKSIVEKSQQIANIVEDMVAVQSQENRTYNLEPTNLIDVIQRTLVAHEKRIDASGLQIVTQFPDQLPLALADAGAVGDAFSKMLDNALKFGAEGGKIDIMVRDTDGPMIQVGIRDYGIGIPEHEHTRIFQRFYQVDGSATRRYGGTGLGLAVAKSIVESHGGKIGLSSKLGDGTIFYFSLPKYDMNLKKSTGYLTAQG